jgi:hypothetical protein
VCIVIILVVGREDVKRQAMYRLTTVFSEHANRASRGEHVKSHTQYLGKTCDTTPCLLLLTVKGLLLTPGQEECESLSRCRSSRSV